MRHALTLEILFMSLFGLVRVWFGVGILCFVFLWFSISMFWPGMVLNQGQLSIVVSDWEPYLGAFFPTCLGGKFTFFMALCLWASRFVFVLFIVLSASFLTIKRSCTLTTLHLGPLLQTAVTPLCFLPERVVVRARVFWLTICCLKPTFVMTRVIWFVLSSPHRWLRKKTEACTKCWGQVGSAVFSWFHSLF